MKQYKSGYVLMKAMPFHNGHKFLIDTAIENSDKVTVVVGSLPTEPIPGELRFKWVTEQYRTNPNVTVVHCTEVLPQYPEDDENFWDTWVSVAKRYCPADIDVIFTSEDYGHTYARNLGISHYQVDIARHTVPVSGTKVRTNPFEMWDMIPDHVKPYFVKRIVIMGSESCGKSTLTKNLAKHYQTNYVEEYGRVVYEENNNEVSISDFLKISHGRQLIEDAMIKQSNKLLFCDTEDITTMLFLEMYYPSNEITRADQLIQFDVRKKLLKEYETKKPYDLYILLKPDCDAIQDGTRNYLDQRCNHYNNIKDEMVFRNYNFVEIGGNWDNRFNEALKIIAEKFGL